MRYCYQRRLASFLMFLKSPSFYGSCFAPRVYLEFSFHHERLTTFRTLQHSLLTILDLDKFPYSRPLILYSIRSQVLVRINCRFSYLLLQFVQCEHRKSTNHVTEDTRNDQSIRAILLSPRTTPRFFAAILLTPFSSSTFTSPAMFSQTNDSPPPRLV